VKILLDNCVHYDAKQLFVGHDVKHARDMKWRELENGELLAAAASGGFSVLVTTDKNMRHQHDLKSLPLSVLELNSLFTRIDDLRALSPFFESALDATSRHRFISLNPGGTLECLAERDQVLERTKDRGIDRDL